MRDLISYGADMNYQVPQVNFSMPMFAVHRGHGRLLDVMLEAGASTDIQANGISVHEQYIKCDKAIH